MYSQATLGILHTDGQDFEAFIGTTTLGRVPLQHAFIHCIRCLTLLQSRSSPAPAQKKKASGLYCSVVGPPGIGLP